MTDEEAKEKLLYLVEAYSPRSPVQRALAHALQALADRQALVRAVAHATLLDTMLAEIFDAARRHMEGK